MSEPNPRHDGRTVTMRVPISIRKRGGRKLVLAPDGANGTWARRIGNAMVKAIARAYRWREMLENSKYATIAEIAAAEKINESSAGRVLRLTLLAPDMRPAGSGARRAGDDARPAHGGEPRRPQRAGSRHLPRRRPFRARRPAGAHRAPRPDQATPPEHPQPSRSRQTRAARPERRAGFGALEADRSRKSREEA